MVSSRDLIEVFGFNPDDLTPEVRALWKLGGCPFINQRCTKYNHDQSIVYGVCSVTAPLGNVVICPNRLYANDYESIREVCRDAFGPNSNFMFFGDFIKHRHTVKDCVVALGQNSGREVKLNSLSMDWVLARIQNLELVEYVGIEVQSIDITGNYRDAWHGYKNYKTGDSVPNSEHGLNFANVHKRLIPQLIRKGVVYSRSKLVKKGLYFVVPEIVYQKFEDTVGKIPTVAEASNGTLTVHTYGLSGYPAKGSQRNLVLKRRIRFTLDEFAHRFIAGPNLPDGVVLDRTIRQLLGVR